MGTSNESHPNGRRDESSDMPNGGVDNRNEVQKQNKEANAKAQSKSAPDGSTQGFKKTAEDFKTHNEKKEANTKVSIRGASTFSWRNVGSWNAGGNSDKKKSLEIVHRVETYIIDHLYGDWYWNTAIMLGTCYFCWLIGRIGGGILSLGFVLLFTQSVYRQEIRRFNRNIRDDLTRSEGINRLDNELETMEWLNSFLDKFWVIYMPALSETVLYQTNEILKDLAPGYGIEKLKLNEFTLGSKAPRVDSIKSYTRKGHDHIEMDWAFSFAPNDTDDMTKNEIKKKINPKVALGVTIGKAFISKEFPILVEDQTFKGRMNIKLKLNQNFPHVKTVEVQFLEPPTIDYSLKPVGGDTLGIDVMSFIPGLSNIVMTLIHGTLRPMFYAPNSFVVDVEELMASFNNDSIGCAVVTVKRAENLKLATSGKKTKANSFNPYVQLKVENNPDIEERTKTKKSINDPIFMETKFILINALEGNHLNFNVFDLIPDKPDDQLIGTVQFPLADLLQEDEHMGVVKNIMESGKVVGKLEFNLKWFPTLAPKVLEDGTKEAITDSEVGILKLNLHEARDLDLSDTAVGLLNPYAEIYINNELLKSCRQLIATNEPSWEQTLEALITEQSHTTVQVLVKDSANDTIVGALNSNLQDLIFETSRGQQWMKMPSTDKVSGHGIQSNFRITAQWKALGMHDDKIGTFRDASIGGLRVHLRSASDVINLESVGKVDPYIRCIMNGNLRARTATLANTLDPHFNAVYFFPVANEHQHILLQLMDAEDDGKDRPLGSCAINVYDFLKKSSDGHYLAYDGSNEVLEQPILYNGDKHGYLSYSVSFIPTLPVYSMDQRKNKDKYLKSIEEKKADEAKKLAEDEKTYKEHPNEYEWVAIGDEDIIDDAPKLDVPLEKAIKYRSGNIVCHLLGGTFDKPDVYVHTLFDDHAYPAGVSDKSSGRNLKNPSLAECFIRDLPNSKVIFRLGNKVEINSEKEVLVEKTFDTINLLERSYAKPITLNLNTKNTVKVQFEYIPSPVKLAPLDTILDVGYIKIDLLGADNLPSVDSNGKSDPLCVVKLDGVEVFKTNKKRRTLDPVWNEAVEIPVQSRSRQVIMLEVYDWDLTHDDELLGRAVLDLSTIDPNESTPFKADLDKQGRVNLRVTFKPDYIRPKLSTTTGLQIDLNKVGDVPLQAVGGAANIAGNVAGGGIGLASDTITKGGSFIKGLGRGSKKSKDKKSDKSDKSEKSADTTANGGDADTSFSDVNSSQTEQNESNSDDSPKKSANQYANELQSLRSGQTQPSVHGAAPNILPELLPPPQRPNVGGVGHTRNSSSFTDNSSFIGNEGTSSIPGRVNIIGGKGLPSGNIEVKVSLQNSEKEKDIFKTRAGKNDKNGVINWNESIPFKSTSDATLVFHVREKHSFGKNKELGAATLPLSEVLNHSEDKHLAVGSGSITVNVRYISG
ncbi:tricalbin-3 [[Candida] railenensis]|uniref:Tricalbin-3 n=1 Tax=[Candida] railenensis TaxID=45579 RepID=A0A9P0QMH7_9ASCO|nr:tricalbin-3 [[Candida] railenensis]